MCKVSGSRKSATFTFMPSAWVRPLRIMRDRPIMKRSRGKCSKGMLLMTALSAKGLTSASGIALRTQAARYTDSLPNIEVTQRLPEQQWWLLCPRRAAQKERQRQQQQRKAACDQLSMLHYSCTHQPREPMQTMAAPGVKDDAGDCGDCQGISRAARRRPKLQSHALHSAGQH